MKKVVLKSVIFLLVTIVLFSCASDNNVLKTVPQLTTTTLTNITLNTASSGGNITSDGGEAVIERGIVWNTSTSPTTTLTTKTTNGAGTGIFSSTITNLIPSSTYFVRAYASNSLGTAYGNELSFTTGAIVLPTVSTTAITNITTNSAVSGGNITANGGGTITALGVVWDTTQNPTIALTTKTTVGIGLGNFISNISNLTPGITYYVRAYATNNVGTAYGTEVNFTTTNCNSGSTITNIDGNTYNTIVMGNQIWMKENLNTSKYSNGDPITNFTTQNDWQYSVGGSSYYGFVVNKLEGKLYNGFAVQDPRGLCPCGYHIPSKDEWINFQNYLTAQGASSGVNPAKAIASKINWPLSLIANAVGNDPNLNNTSNFSAFPSGVSDGYGRFKGKGEYTFWWTSNKEGGAVVISYWSTDIDYSNNKDRFGASVRCLKN